MSAWTRQKNRLTSGVNIPIGRPFCIRTGCPSPPLYAPYLAAEVANRDGTHPVSHSFSAAGGTPPAAQGTNNE